MKKRYEVRWMQKNPWAKNGTRHTTSVMANSRAEARDIIRFRASADSRITSMSVIQRG
ncbi:MAG: hypothetical protein ACI4OA_01430 [Selenomonadaceae bacterium]